MDRFISLMAVSGKLAACYLIAAAIQFSYMLWPNFGGHPHIPFSAFPWSLIFVPIVPIDSLVELYGNGFDLRIVKTLAVFGAVFITSAILLFSMPGVLRRRS